MRAQDAFIVQIEALTNGKTANVWFTRSFVFHPRNCIGAMCSWVQALASGCKIWLHGWWCARLQIFNPTPISSGWNTRWISHHYFVSLLSDFWFFSMIYVLTCPYAALSLWWHVLFCRDSDKTNLCLDQYRAGYCCISSFFLLWASYLIRLGLALQRVYPCAFDCSQTCSWHAHIFVRAAHCIVQRLIAAQHQLHDSTSQKGNVCK